MEILESIILNNTAFLYNQYILPLQYTKGSTQDHSFNYKSYQTKKKSLLLIKISNWDRKESLESDKIANSRASELGDSLGTLRDGVLGQFTGQHKPDRGLNFP